MHPRIKSFIYAFKGLRVLLHEEPHARFHVLAAIVVCLAGFYFEISKVEWLVIILCIGGVLSAEAFNTAVENLGNAITIEHNINIEKAKDVAAAAVLIVSVASAMIGMIIFLPYVI